MNSKQITFTGERARHFLEIFRKALMTHDYEAIEQLRRSLAIEGCRRSVKRGISEPTLIPTTLDVEKWLAILESDGNEELFSFLQQTKSLPAEDAQSA